MQVYHSYKEGIEGKDFIRQILKDNLHIDENLVMAEVFREDNDMVTIYLHPINSLIHASTDLVKHPDLYVVTVDGSSLISHCVGKNAHPDIRLFDLTYYNNLSDKIEKFDFLIETLLKNSQLPSQYLIHVNDFRRKVRIDEFFVSESVLQDG